LGFFKPDFILEEIRVHLFHFSADFSKKFNSKPTQDSLLYKIKIGIIVAGLPYYLSWLVIEMMAKMLISITLFLEKLT
jgi:hypothetical protein